jgi:hypothetical protein
LRFPELLHRVHGGADEKAGHPFRNDETNARSLLEELTMFARRLNVLLNRGAFATAAAVLLVRGTMCANQ